MFTSLALSRPLTLEDGRCLRTLADAGEMVLSLTPDEQAQARMVLKRAFGGGTNF